MRVKGLGTNRYYWHVSSESTQGERWGPTSTFLILDQIDEREAKKYTRDMVREEGAPGYTVTRLNCSVKSKLKARCSFAAFAGDSSINGSGNMFYKRKTPDNFRFYHYDFRVEYVDAYCISVLDKPRSQCTELKEWHG